MKLAERTIQFADTLTVLTEGYLRAARVLQAEGSHADAAKYFITANQGQPGNVLAAIGLAQTHLKKGGPPKCCEMPNSNPRVRGDVCRHNVPRQVPPAAERRSLRRGVSHACFPSRASSPGSLQL